MKNMKKVLSTLGLVLLLSSCGTTSANNIYKVNKNEYKVQYSELRAASKLIGDVPSIGERKLLVVPVQFKDYTCAKLTNYGGCDGVRDDIQASFFGKSEDTAWESVSSFYEKSSYGNLKFSGEVTPWYSLNMTAAQLAQRIDDVNPSRIVLREVAEWYNTLEGSNIKDYDTNGDGYIDAVWMVYAAESRLSGGGIPADSDLFWAFVYWDYNNNAPNVESPTPYSYAWASYDFMYDDKVQNEAGQYVPITDENGNILPDAHTWIHETGHLLGLEDYYTYDDTGDYAAAAALDMMDNNIGDHNAWSKSILGWVEPTVVKGPGTVTIKPFESSGDALLVKKHWDEKEDPEKEGKYLPDKGGILDEYLMIEFYTPTGLNKWDSEHNYAQYYPKLFTEMGIKIYHIDARIGGFYYSNLLNKWVLRGYTDIIGTKYEHYEMGNSNTRSRSGTPDYKLIHLLESSGENSFKTQGSRATATNDTLFQLGDSFGYDAFKGFEFNSVDDKNNQLKLGLKFKITEMTSEGATIVFKNA